MLQGEARPGIRDDRVHAGTAGWRVGHASHVWLCSARMGIFVLRIWTAGELRGGFYVRIPFYLTTTTGG